MKPDPKPKTFRSKKYLAFIRSKPCCVCAAHPPSQAHHESITGRGMGIKCSDIETVPLCATCHGECHSKFIYWDDEIPQNYMLRYINEWLNRKEDAM